ncbi:hypothetical protein K504DRAFT_465112 [Pleomassaria siparia CBS 279.74]|uniref:Secreted protein n=1 Tax=Pleomassaria siparia CBS 279.74 TaxID=1314801 RepID=A0A6G1KES1_9PLEO|nr:hypothetical protein K504DRAFT_465112 [Pleomassaria siparia CBS 279.74]
MYVVCSLRCALCIVHCAVAVAAGSPCPEAPLDWTRRRRRRRRRSTKKKKKKNKTKKSS